MEFRDLDPTTAQAELDGDTDLRILDVRTLEEHASHRLPNAVLVPIQELQQRVGELDASANWLVVCAHGQRSMFACQFLEQMGFDRIANLRGGLAHWASSGLPLEH